MKYLIIGAGSCGLAVAKALNDNGIAYDHVDADHDIGGNWLHGVYETVYTDACKDVMQYPEFPMPASYPDFLSKGQMLAYLNSYTDHFDLRKNIRFNTTVISVNAMPDNKWYVCFRDGKSLICNGVVICNGHHWDKRYADLQGSFSGEVIHSKDYKTPSQLNGKRVLVIGSGNSAADIACEAARVGTRSTMSMKDSPWIFPKSFMGIPLGRMKVKNATQFLQPLLVMLLIQFTFGRHSLYGLATPQHKPFDKHPTVSEELPYYLRHGRIKVKPAITKTENRTVWFDDNSNDEFDIIVSATGFNLTFPFLPDELVRKEGQHLKCLGYCVYPDYKGLFFVGWPQVRGGIGSLASVFSKLVVDLIRLEEEFNYPSGALLRAMGYKECDTHLHGTKDVFDMVASCTYERLKRVAGKGPKHTNKLTFYVPDEAVVKKEVY